MKQEIIIFGSMSCIIFLLITHFLAGSTLVNAKLADYTDPHCVNGTSVITHLFEWTWSSIERECPILAKAGYCGVQISIPGECRVVTSPVMRPWWERYQPVSYILESRSGTEAEFKRMVAACNGLGVRIFSDIVIKSMAGGSGIGTADSTYYAMPQNLSYPSVPYNTQDFSNTRSEDCQAKWGTNSTQMRDCGVTNLNQSELLVQQKIVDFLNHLVHLGVAGFRIDSSLGMWPTKLKTILDQVDDVQMGGRPYAILEVPNTIQFVIQPDEYFNIGYVTEFNFAERIGYALTNNFSALFELLEQPLIRADRALMFVDNHDTQRHRMRPDKIYLDFRHPYLYRLAQSISMALGYGHARVMSSYYFTNDEASPPHDNNYNILNVTTLPDNSCGNGWVCEHRWSSTIAAMKFRKLVNGTNILNMRNNGKTFSFSRGDLGFFVAGKTSFDSSFLTGLPAGKYCDLISECKQKVDINSSGRATLKPFSPACPMVALVNEKMLKL